MKFLDENLQKNIENAYRKYKHHVYRDNTFSLLREQLSIFDSNQLKDKLEKITQFVLDATVGNNPFELWLNKIDFWLFPKSIKPTLPASETFLSNLTINEKIEVKKDFALINAPVPLHILSVLWILEGGFHLENDMSLKPYGNKLDLNDDKGRVLNGFALFKPYYKLYQNWRDKAFEKATQLIEDEKNVLILSLDVKDYFPSIKVDYQKIKETVNARQENTQQKERFNFLTDILEAIHTNYEIKLKKANIRETYGLPIGLLSSSIIANWYLNEFDKKVSEAVNPVYYGRYVDDILMVISNPKMPSNEAISQECIKKSKKNEKYKESEQEIKANFIKREVFKWYFERNEIIKYQENENTFEIILSETEGNSMVFQNDKIKFIYFDYSQPVAMLHKFQKELKIESSEFRLLPEEATLNDEFYTEAHFLAFDGSVNKLRNVTGFGVDIFGASKFLAKKIYSALQSDREKDQIASKQILTFFQGARAIESSKLWEKVATYFVVTKDKKNLIKFIENVKSAVNRLIDDKESKAKLFQFTLRKSLFTSVTMALALEGVRNENFGKKDENDLHLPEKFSTDDLRIENLLKNYDIINNNIDKLIIVLRKSNLIRHNYIKLPLINYTKYAASDEGLKRSYLNIDLIPEININGYDDFELDNEKFKFSPRYIHFHEIALSEFRQQLLKKSKKIKNAEETLISFETREDKKEDKKGYIEQSKVNFEAANEYVTSKYKIKFDYEHFAKSSIRNKSKEEEKIVIKQISIDTHQKKEKLRIGLVNMKLDERNIKESYLKNPIFDKKRKEDINHLLNLIEKESWKYGKLDMIVLPEVSIPYKALSWLCQYALQHEVIMVFGLEHWIVNNVAFNFMVTLLPFHIKNTDENIDGYKAILPVFRIKNHYSHTEKTILESYRYEIPKLSPNEYHIFNWKGINFATFNCFELADIKHRAMFRDEVDLVVACENNKDTSYFSNIVESYVRDLHCYMIQANNSKFGDTRITKPVCNAEMNQVKIKGGINAVVLIDEIDIKSLRDFQIQEYIPENKDFKPTPPGFDKGKAMKRRGKNLNE
jgi:hypothetical protein